MWKLAFHNFAHRPLGKRIALLPSRSFHFSKCMLAERAKFVRDKVHMNVGTIGHVDHGKTTLTAAITKLLAEKKYAEYITYEMIDKTPEERKRGITITASHVEYVTDTRHYAHIDCPGHQHYVKNMITGAAQMDCGILVVSAPDGPQEQTKEHLILAKEIGVPSICVFLNKVDVAQDSDMVDMVESEVRELMTKYGYDGDNAPVVRGSAKLAVDEEPQKATENGRESIWRLLQALDEKIPVPERAIDKPLLMPVEDIFSIAGRGTVVTGRIEQGTMKIGDDVAVVGPKPISKVAITGIEMFKKQMDKAIAGDNVGALLRGLKRDDVMRGEIVCKPGTVTAYKKFTAKIYCLTTAEGGRKKPFGTNYQPQFFLRTANITGTVIMPKEKMAMPGDSLEIEVHLIYPLAMVEGMRFTMREGQLTVGSGVIIKILE